MHIVYVSAVHERVVHIQVAAGPGAVELAEYARVALFVLFVWARAVVVLAVRARQAAGDEVVTVDGPVVAVFFHGHLRDRRVHVTRGGVAAEAEVAEAVENIAAVVGFHFLQNVRVRAENDVRARVNGRVSEGFLIGSHLVAALRAPVRREDQDGALFNRLSSYFLPRAVN